MPNASPPIEVRTLTRGHGVFALTDLPAGAVILAFVGEEVATPNRRTLQLDDTRHLDIPAACSEAEAVTRFPWRYLNHGCDPNARVAGRDLVALRAIPTGEQIRFDYNTTEWELAEPFACSCGEGACTGQWVRGLAHLPRETQDRLRGHLAPHLRNALDRQRAGET